MTATVIPFEDIAARTRAAVARYFGRDVSTITDELDIFDDLGADSLEHTDLCIAVETALNRELDPLASINTVGDLVAAVGGRT